MRIKLELNDKNTIIEDGRNLPDCTTLEAKTALAGGVIAIASAIISVVGILTRNKHILFISYTGLIFSIGVLSAFDLGRKLGDRLIRRE